VDPKRVGSELGVRYVLDGRVRRTESVVRINAHLIDTRTAAEIWSERFDGEWTKSMQLQDVITGRLARRLDLELTNEESRRAGTDRPNSPDAVDLAMRGWAVLNQPYSREQLAQSRALFARTSDRCWADQSAGRPSRGARVGGKLSPERCACGSATAR
jgi:adenylate cyclase